MQASAVANALCAVSLSLASFAPPASAQTLVISLTDDSQGGPVAGAAVELLTQSGKPVLSRLSDDAGKVVLAVPESGQYIIRATRIGYETFRSPLLALVTQGSAKLELVLRPQPIGLEGLEVTAEGRAKELLAPLGISTRELGTRWIDRQKIDAIQMPGQALDVLRWQAVPGMSVSEVDSAGHKILCVTLRGPRACALTVLNGVVVSRELAIALASESLEAIAVLRPVEATTLYGTEAGGGAVLFWTRQGRTKR